MANNAKIKVVADDMGNIIRTSPNNPEYGFVRLVQNKMQISNNGWVQPKRRSTLLKGTVEDLKAMDINTNTELTGNIVVIESFEPFRKVNPEKDLKIAGETGIVCKGVDPETGEVRDIYRDEQYDGTGLLHDKLIPHVNGEEIREANAVSSMEKPLSKSDLKDLSKKKDKVEEKVEEEVEMEEETFEL